MEWPSIALTRPVLPDRSEKAVLRAYRPRKKRRKNRRMLFDRRKSHILPLVPGFLGFNPFKDSGLTGFLGFSDRDVMHSVTESHEMRTVLHEKYLMPFHVPLPITCSSILVDCRGPQYSLKVFPIPCLRIRVLSLFDGIATGLHILLDKLHLEVDAYFSVEIDCDALKVQRHNYFGQIISLGDARDINDTLLHSLGRIDLLIGGSPCNEISMVNPARRGLEDITSSGHLFYKYVEVKNFLQQQADCRKHCFFWLFENTSHMEKQTKAAMSKALGARPIVRCSSAYLPVKRRRLFWGQLPGMRETLEHQRYTQRRLQDILKPYRCATVDILPTLTTSSHSQRSGFNASLPIEEDGIAVGLTVIEREELFGFPAHYTDTGDLNNHRRAKLLGRCWSVPVVTELLRPLSEIYKKQR